MRRSTTAVVYDLQPVKNRIAFLQGTLTRLTWLTTVFLTKTQPKCLGKRNVITFFYDLLFQKEEKQLDAGLDGLINKVQDLKSQIAAFIVKLETEYEMLNW